MLREIILVFGLIMCTATQLRLPGLSLGLGELSLVGWLGLGTLQRIGKPRAPNAVLRIVQFFWACMAIFQALGLMMGMATELFFDTPSIIHDIIAYTLLFSIGWMMSVEFADACKRRRVVWMLVVGGAGVLMLEVANGFGLIGAPGVEPWYYDRLRGWSHDPNQLGFFCTVIALLSIYLTDTETAPRRWGSALGAGLVALMTGMLTKSDSFIVSLAAGCAVFMSFRAWGWLYARDRQLRSALASLLLFAAPFCAVAALPFIPHFLRMSEAYSNELYDDNDQGDARVKLWKEAVSKGIEAKLIGFGPGPHLTAKSFKRPPPDKFEAHNVVLDLFTQGGLAASLSFILLVSSMLFLTLRAGLPALAGLAGAFILFSMFHFIFRHPVFWFGVILCLSEAISVLEPARRGATRRIPPRSDLFPARIVS